MSIRPVRHVTALAGLAAALTLGAAVAAPAAHAAVRPGVERPATIIGTEYGYGATLTAAEQNARSQMYGDYYGCTVPILVADGQQTDGSWWAEEKANCKGYN